MNADELLLHYERIADAPEAVARLRRFVLDLAVRGKLVPQDLNDEPASVMLGQITAGCGSPKLKSGASTGASEEAPFPVPTGWCWTRLGALVKHSDSGWSPKTLDQERAGDAWGVLKVSAVSWGAFRPWENKQVLPCTKPRLQAQVSRGDFLISRANTAELVARAVIVEEEPLRLMMSDKIVRLSLIAECSHRFVLLVNNSAAFAREYYAERASGVSPSMKNVTREVILGLPMPFPPPAEQHRIVAKVDELMALCDRLEAARAQREAARDRLVRSCLARLDRPDPETFREDARLTLDALPALAARRDQIKPLRQTILNLAVRGKLVPQDSNDQSGSDLLIRIANDKASAAGSRGSPGSDKPAVLPKDAWPFVPPAGWAWVAFGDIVKSRDGDRIPVSREERNGRAKVYDYYGASGVIDKIDKYLFDKPLLLIGEDGANLVNRSTPIAFIARGKYWVNNHAHVLDALSEWLLQYLELFINATDLMPFITGTAQPKMNQAKMNSIPVALPPLAEQSRIVAKVDELLALCDRLEASLQQADEHRRRLLEALLHEALEPAAALEEQVA